MVNAAVLSLCESAVPFRDAVLSKMTAALSATACVGVEYAEIDCTAGASPAGPVAPVAPVAPAGPVAPVAPVAPAGPVGQVTYGNYFVICSR